MADVLSRSRQHVHISHMGTSQSWTNVPSQLFSQFPR